MAKLTTIYMRNYCKVKTNNLAAIKNFIILLSAIALLYSSCKKDTNTLQVEFINPDSAFNSTFETVGLNAYTTSMDSLATHQQSLYILGAINDPIFGKSRATVLTSFSIPNNAASFSFGDISKVIVDSVVLQLRIGNDSTYAGNPKSIHDIKVYEMVENLSDSAMPFFSSRNFIKSNTVVGTFNSLFTPNDSIPNTYTYSDVKIPACVRIKMSEEFKLKVQNQNTFVNSDFSKLFRGFAIIDESNFAPGEGGFWYMNLNSFYTNLVVYYRNDTTHLRSEFPIQYSNAKYNKFESNSSNLTQPKTVRFTASQQRDIGYLQSMAGTKIKVFIPDSVLNRLAASPQLAIQKAELVIKTLDGFDDNNYRIPSILKLTSTDSTGKDIELIDYFSESYSYLNGIEKNRVYRFNMARELNFILTNLRNGKGNIHYGLSIIVPNGLYGAIFPISARRVVLNTKDLKLNINYSVIK